MGKPCPPSGGKPNDAAIEREGGQRLPTLQTYKRASCRVLRVLLANYACFKNANKSAFILSLFINGSACEPPL